MQSQQPKISKNLSVEEIQQINGNPNTGVSVCIARVFNNITWRQVKQVFIELNWGFVERVDIIRVKSKDGKMVKRAFIHFAPMKWNMRSDVARATLTALQSKEVIKVSYEEDKPWFWTVTVSKCIKPELSDLKEKSLRHKSMRKERLDLSEVVSHQKVSIKRRSNDDELLEKKRQHQTKQAESKTTTVNLDDPISARAASTSPRENHFPKEKDESAYDPMMDDTFA
jgi:hypothetical protein